MDFGFFLPSRGPLATADGIRKLARHAEQLGFALIGVPDHIVIPNAIAPHYPYSDTGEFPGGKSGECLEQLALLAFLAGQTASVRLLTSIMVLPHRNPVLAAKMLATIDVLSGGRLTVGCAVGWMKEEFEALAAPPFAERGRVGDEYIRVLRELWTSDAPTFDGAYVRFSDVTFLPRPVQRPHPPLWVGGESPPAMRRAARLGDGWYPIGSNPNFPLDTIGRYADAVSRLRGYAEAAGRDPAEITLAYCALRWGGSSYGGSGPAADGPRRLLGGEPQQIAGDIAELGALGVRHLMLNFQSTGLDETCARMDWFAKEVMPLAPG